MGLAGSEQGAPPFWMAIVTVLLRVVIAVPDLNRDVASSESGALFGTVKTI